MGTSNPPLDRQEQSLASRDPRHASLHELRHQSELLRLDFLRNSIDFSLTVADLARRSRGANETIRAEYRRTAQKGYQAVLAIMQKASIPESDAADLESSVDLLGKVIDSLVSPAGPAILAAESPAAGPNPPRHEHQPSFEVLTPRELEVLREVAKGKSTKLVAHELGMSFKTAACHRYRIMDKLGIHELANLVRLAIREGLVEP